MEKTKHMECLITYKKSNGDILIRPRLTDGGLKIGQETSMGWKVLNIHYEFQGNYYTQTDYLKMLLHRHKVTRKERVMEYIVKKANKRLNQLKHEYYQF